MSSTVSVKPSRYIALPNGPYNDWAGCECEDYKPTDRQAIVIEAVQSALDAKLFYTSDVLEHCKVFLNVTPEQATVKSQHVEGGDFGMDCYYARSYIQAQVEYEKKRIALSRLQPRVNQSLGTLVFNDYKRNTGMTIIALSENGKIIDLAGKRGAYTIKLSCNAKQIEHAINRAFEKKMRKDNFDAFVTPVTDKSTLF